MKLYLDPGHGGTDSGAVGNGLQEKNLTLDIALRIRDLLLKNFSDVSLRLSRTTDIYKSLAERTMDANSWGADYYLSIHINSVSNTSASGYEDYIHDSLSDSSTTARYQKILHEEITALNSLHDRGVKKANFHVLRESSMPAFLSENGFISNANDAAKMKDPAWRQKVAQGHVNGLAKAFNLMPVTVDETHRVIVDGVQVGAYQNDQNVIDAVKRYLKSAKRIVVERI
jgi:N-acetylmuramoyl-L-alanine amidase